MSDSILGFISGPSVNIWFMHSVFTLFKDMKMGPRFGADWLMVYGPYIHNNRNQLVREFLTTDSSKEWMFMVDNDIVFKPEDVKPIYELADKKGPGVYSGPYVLEDSSMVCGVWDAEVEKVYHPLMQLPAEPREIGVVGAGFTLIHREVLEKMEDNWFTALTPEMGEDLSFSWRSIELGYTPWLVPQANPGHFKSVVLYPHEQVRNMVGNEVNLVRTTVDVANS